MGNGVHPPFLIWNIRDCLPRQNVVREQLHRNSCIEAAARDQGLFQLRDICLILSRAFATGGIRMRITVRTASGSIYIAL